MAMLRHRERHCFRQVLHAGARSRYATPRTRVPCAAKSGRSAAAFGRYPWGLGGAYTEACWDFARSCPTSRGPCPLGRAGRSWSCQGSHPARRLAGAGSRRGFALEDLAVGGVPPSLSLNVTTLLPATVVKASPITLGND